MKISTNFPYTVWYLLAHGTCTTLTLPVLLKKKNNSGVWSVNLCWHVERVRAVVYLWQDRRNSYAARVDAMVLPGVLLRALGGRRLGSKDFWAS